MHDRAVYGGCGGGGGAAGELWPACGYCAAPLCWLGLGSGIWWHVGGDVGQQGQLGAGGVMGKGAQPLGGPVCHAAVKPHALKPSQRPRRRTSRRRPLYLVYLSGFLCTGFLLFIIFFTSVIVHTHTHSGTRTCSSATVLRFMWNTLGENALRVFLCALGCCARALKSQAAPKFA